MWAALNQMMFSVVRFGKILLSALEWSLVEVFLIFQMHTTKITEFTTLVELPPINGGNCVVAGQLSALKLQSSVYPLIV